MNALKIFFYFYKMRRRLDNFYLMDQIFTHAKLFILLVHFPQVWVHHQRLRGTSNIRAARERAMRACEPVGVPGLNRTKLSRTLPESHGIESETDRIAMGGVIME